LSIFPVPPLFVSADVNLLSAVNELGLVRFLAGDASSALKHPDLLNSPPGTILVLDAQVPQTSASSPDRQERAAMRLLRELRANGIRIPALVITLLTVGTSELYDYCSPDNNAIALPLQHLNRQTVAAFIGMLEAGPQAPQSTWDVIEVEVKHDSAKCFLGSRGSAMFEWAQAPTRNRMAQRLALQYNIPDFSPGWARRIHTDGGLLFNDLVISTLGRGLFAHLEQAAGGLAKLAFRFRVEDATLYSAPFEAAVRESEQPFSGEEDDFDQHPFVLIYAPIARRMKGVTLRTASASVMPRPARLLFIRSQLGESEAGATEINIVGVQETDREDGRSRLKPIEFRKLDHIDRERDYLQSLETAGSALFSMEVLDFSKGCGPGGAETTLLRTLNEKNFDVVHFAGHSLTTRNGLTLLVLPSDRPGEAEGMSIHAFAEGVAAANARLVYLSSCEGSSANTVASLGQRGVPHVIGFRWIVDDERAAEFARLFYSELFGPKSAMISGAFRAACRGVYKPEHVEASPIWASPVLASVSDNWMAQRVL
jgi:hypothetical protein